jgi:hypothetical protein
MAMDFKGFASIVGPIADARHPIMIRGRHGVGKSETVYAFAKKVGKRVVERRASQMTEGDLVGLPVVDGDRTSWNPPDWFKQACEEGVVLFMDEIDRAVQEVRQGFFQLTDSRTINGHRLHPDTLIFAAVNGGTNGAQYAVNDMDPAELDRWTVFDLEPTVEDWIQFASGDGKVNDIIVDFIRDNHAHLEHKGEFEPNKKYPSRRSWVRFNTVVDSLLKGDDYKKNAAHIYQIGTGFIGMEASVAFQDFIKNRENMLSVDDILVHGKIGHTKKLKLNDHLVLIEKIGASKRLSGTMPQSEVENLGRYFLSMPSEAAMKFYATATQGAGNDIKFVLNFHKLTVDGKSIKAHINELMSTSNKKDKK